MKRLDPVKHVQDKNNPADKNAFQLLFSHVFCSRLERRLHVSLAALADGNKVRRSLKEPKGNLLDGQSVGRGWCWTCLSLRASCFMLLPLWRAHLNPLFSFSNIHSIMWAFLKLITQKRSNPDPRSPRERGVPGGISSFVPESFKSQNSPV